MNERAKLLSNRINSSHNERLNIDSDVESVQNVYPRVSRRRKGAVLSNTNNFTAIDNDDIEPENLLDQGIEAFNYDTTQNDLFNKEIEENAKNRSLRIRIMRYLILFFIGFFTGLSAFLFDLGIEKMASFKFQLLGRLFKKYDEGIYSIIPGFVWSGFNVGLVLICATMVVFLAPIAAGSGIPQVKCYLNGVNVPFMMRFRTLLVKGIGVVLSVGGGLAVGKEGPMIHTGAGIAAGLSQGRLTWLGTSSKIFRPFRNDHEKRDFVSAGAAAGVAAAFGAPVGGLLFSLEEGASFVNQRLTWKILFSSMTSMFVLAFLRSTLSNDFPNFTPGGLISFGTFDNLNCYTIFEILVFIVIGIIGGVMGALFNRINLQISKFRITNISSSLAKILEAGLVAFITACVSFTVMVYQQDCRSLGADPIEVPLQMLCADSEFNSVASLFFQTPEKSVRSLLHDPPGTYNMLTLFIFTIVYFLLACYTYGLSVPSGLFIPCLLCGAGWGRLLGSVLHFFNSTVFPDPGKFALIGAAAQLGGVVRMTVSLTVILMEATGNIIVGLPLLITLVVAKYFGDLFNEGIYDMHIDLSGFALLPWQPDDLSVTQKAYDGMSSPVTCLHTPIRVKELIKRVSEDPHHAFPIVEGGTDPENHLYGTLIGLIQSDHLALIIKEKIFFDPENHFQFQKALTVEDFDNCYPRFPKFQEVAALVLDTEKDCFVDLKPYMNEAPYRVTETMTMNRVFNLFRLLGLRHLPVVDTQNQVRGIITRKDVRRFKFERRNGKIYIEEMLFSQQI